MTYVFLGLTLCGLVEGHCWPAVGGMRISTAGGVMRVFVIVFVMELGGKFGELGRDTEMRMEVGWKRDGKEMESGWKTGGRVKEWRMEETELGGRKEVKRWAAKRGG